MKHFTFTIHQEAPPRTGKSTMIISTAQHSTAQHSTAQKLTLEREIKEYFKQLVDRDPDELNLTEISADVLQIIRQHT